MPDHLPLYPLPFVVKTYEGTQDTYHVYAEDSFARGAGIRDLFASTAPPIPDWFPQAELLPPPNSLESFLNLEELSKLPTEIATAYQRWRKAECEGNVRDFLSKPVFFSEYDEPEDDSLAIEGLQNMCDQLQARQEDAYVAVEQINLSRRALREARWRFFHADAMMEARGV